MYMCVTNPALPFLFIVSSIIGLDGLQHCNAYVRIPIYWNGACGGCITHMPADVADRADFVHVMSTPTVTMPNVADDDVDGRMGVLRI